MALFSVRTPGFPEICRDGRLCPLTLRKGLALLIYLAEAQGSVGRDVVAAMLWPETCEDVVRTRLRRLLHRLQLTPGDDALTTDRSTVRWSSASDLQLDSQLFEQACDRILRRPNAQSHHFKRLLRQSRGVTPKRALNQFVKEACCE
ncbi:DNA-binding SARP family transcriptional activator [Paraburkholderia sp. GAS334]